MDAPLPRFDAYHKWLGIAPHEQPPHHYRLLRIELFESNTEVIEHAYNKEVAGLDTQDGDKHAELIEQLKNEFHDARKCLLNRVKKAAYDATLRAQLTVEEKTQDEAEQPEQQHAIQEAIQGATASLNIEINELRDRIQEAAEREKSALSEVEDLNRQLGKKERQQASDNSESRQSTG